MARMGIALAATLAMAGCATQVYVGDVPAPAYTYYRDAKPVLEARCVACHDGADPEAIPLATYSQAYLFRDVVAESVLDGTMPPSEEGESEHGGPSLTEEEVRALVGWVEAGGLMGEPADVERSE